MSDLLLIHDLGTSGDKACVFDRSGRLIDTEIGEYPTHHYPGTGAEQDPADWWRAVCATTRSLAERVDIHDVVAVSFSGQMQCCLPVDSRGVPLHNGIIWSDQRATEQTDLLLREIDASEVYRISGHRASPVYSLEKLMWLRDNEPETYRRTYKMIGVKDYVIHRLTGNFVTDRSDASGTNAFDIHRMEWSEEICRAAGVATSLLPEVHESTDIVGSVTASAAAETGIPEGVPVVCGGGDGACAAVGAGSVAPGTCYLSMGTSGWIGASSEQPIVDPQMRLINFVHLVPGLLMPCGPTSSCGNAMEWVLGLVAHGEGGARHDWIDEEVGVVPAGAGGLLFVPYLAGERAPRWDPDARGAFVGLTLAHTRASLVRAVMEGVGLNLSMILDIFREHIPIDRLSWIGGSRGPVWDKITADALGVEMDLVANSRHATAIGAAVGAAVAAGVGVGLYPDFSVVDSFIEFSGRISPHPSGVQTYAGLKRIFDEAYESINGVIEKLAAVQVSV